MEFMTRDQAFEAAYRAKESPTQDEFVLEAQFVVFYFFQVDTFSELQVKLRDVGLDDRLNSAQAWINLISGLWQVVSRGHCDRHAVERLIERMSAEKWWATIKTMRETKEKVAIALASQLAVLER